MVNGDGSCIDNNTEWLKGMRYSIVEHPVGESKADSLWTVHSWMQGNAGNVVRIRLNFWLQWTPWTFFAWGFRVSDLLEGKTVFNASAKHSLKLHNAWLSHKDGGQFLISLLINSIFYWSHNWMLQFATPARFFCSLLYKCSCHIWSMMSYVCVWERAALKRRTQCRSFPRRSLKEVQFQVMLLSSRTDLFSPLLASQWQLHSRLRSSSPLHH